MRAGGEASRRGRGGDGQEDARKLRATLPTTRASASAAQGHYSLLQISRRTKKKTEIEVFVFHFFQDFPFDKLKFSLHMRSWYNMCRSSYNIIPHFYPFSARAFGSPPYKRKSRLIGLATARTSLVSPFRRRSVTRCAGPTTRS